MYSKNDTVLYGSQGICRIEDITEKEMGGKTIEYYVLKPIENSHATIYVPTQNEMLVSKMKKILSVKEIYQLIQAMPNEELIWIEGDNKRRDAYREILKSGDRKMLIQLIRTLFLRQQELKSKKRKLHANDEKILREAENILHEEFAYVLNINKDEVVPFIFQQIEVTEKNTGDY